MKAMTQDRPRAETVLYGDAAVAPQGGASHDGPPAETVLYGDTALALQTAITTTDEDRATVLGLTAEQRAASDEDFVTLMQETGLHGTNVPKMLFEAKTQAEIAAGRGHVVDGDQIRTWNEEMRRELRDTYGDEVATDLLARTQRFVRQHPDLAAMLKTNGLGSRPTIVRGLIEHVRRVDFK